MSTRVQVQAARVNAFCKAANTLVVMRHPIDRDRTIVGISMSDAERPPVASLGDELRAVLDWAQATASEKE